jgi:hypothetical protein
MACSVRFCELSERELRPYIPVDIGKTVGCLSLLWRGSGASYRRIGPEH